jgi:hypothetical protein
MKNIYQILLILLVTISINSSEKETNRHFCYHLVNESKDELELENSIKKYFKQMKDDSSYCIQYLLKTSNYNALEVYVTQLNDAGIKFRETLSNSKKRSSEGERNLMNQSAKLGKSNEKNILNEKFSSIKSGFNSGYKGDLFDSINIRDINPFHFDGLHLDISKYRNDYWGKNPFKGPSPYLKFYKERKIKIKEKIINMASGEIDDNFEIKLEDEKYVKDEKDKKEKNEKDDM